MEMEAEGSADNPIDLEGVGEDWGCASNPIILDEEDSCGSDLE